MSQSGTRKTPPPSPSASAVADWFVACPWVLDWCWLVPWHSCSHPCWVWNTYCTVSARFSAHAVRADCASASCVVYACWEASWLWLVWKQNATQPICICQTNWIVELSLRAWALEPPPSDSPEIAVARWVVFDTCSLRCVWLVPWQWVRQPCWGRIRAGSALGGRVRGGRIHRGGARRRRVTAGWLHGRRVGRRGVRGRR